MSETSEGPWKVEQAVGSDPPMFYACTGSGHKWGLRQTLRAAEKDADELNENWREGYAAQSARVAELEAKLAQTDELLTVAHMNGYHEGQKAMEAKVKQTAVPY